MTNLVEFQKMYIPDPTKGKPVANGFLYVGVPGQDPTIESNQISVFIKDGDNCDELVPLAQPIRIGAGGVPMYNERPVELFVFEDYAYTVTDKNGSQVYYVGETKLAGITGGSIELDTLVGESLSSLEGYAAKGAVVGQVYQVMGYITAGDGGQSLWKCTSITATGGADGFDSEGVYRVDNGDSTFSEFEEVEGKLSTPDNYTTAVITAPRSGYTEKYYGLVSSETKNQTSQFTDMINGMATVGGACTIRNGIYIVDPDGICIGYDATRNPAFPSEARPFRLLGEMRCEIGKLFNSITSLTDFENMRGYGPFIVASSSSTSDFILTRGTDSSGFGNQDYELYGLNFLADTSGLVLDANYLWNSNILECSFKNLSASGFGVKITNYEKSKCHDLLIVGGSQGASGEATTKGFDAKFEDIDGSDAEFFKVRVSGFDIGFERGVFPISGGEQSGSFRSQDQWRNCITRQCNIGMRHGDNANMQTDIGCFWRGRDRGAEFAGRSYGHTSINCGYSEPGTKEAGSIGLDIGSGPAAADNQLSNFSFIGPRFQNADTMVRLNGRGSTGGNVYNMQIHNPRFFGASGETMLNFKGTPNQGKITGGTWNNTGTFSTSSAGGTYKGLSEFSGLINTSTQELQQRDFLKANSPIEVAVTDVAAGGEIDVGTQTSSRLVLEVAANTSGSNINRVTYADVEEGDEVTIVNLTGVTQTLDQTGNFQIIGGTFTLGNNKAALMKYSNAQWRQIS